MNFNVPHVSNDHNILGVASTMAAKYLVLSAAMVITSIDLVAAFTPLAHAALITLNRNQVVPMFSQRPPLGQKWGPDSGENWDPDLDRIPEDELFAPPPMPTVSPGSSGGSRFASMMARAQQMSQQNEGLDSAAETEAKAANQAAAAARVREADAKAHAAGVDPNDEEAMQKWRRDLAKEATLRMANAAAARESEAN